MTVVWGVTVAEPDNRRLIWKLVEKSLAPFLLVILGAVALDPLKDLWTGPKTYKIYLVGKHSSTETQRIFRGFRAENKISGLTIDDVPVEIEDRDDSTADAADAARLVASRDDALMVVGHVYSQRTISALPVYMGADPPIPLIGTKETNPDLLGTKAAAICSEAGRDCPIVQMSPSDDIQARDQVKFAETELRRRNATKVLVFLILQQVNTDNSAYSDYLTSRIEANLKNIQKIPDSEVLPPAGITADLASYIQAVNTINAKKPDCVFLATNPDMTRDFLNYAQKEIATEPMIMISDGSIQPDIISEGLGSYHDLYGTYQISSSQYRQEESIIGRDAFAIVEKLVWEAGQHRPMNGLRSTGYWWRRLLSMHRVGDARRAIASVMEDDVKHSAKFSGRSDVTYQFETPYKRKDYTAAFHVWHISHTTICDVDEGDADCKPPQMTSASLVIHEFRALDSHVPSKEGGKDELAKRRSGHKTSADVASLVK